MARLAGTMTCHSERLAADRFQGEAEQARVAGTEAKEAAEPLRRAREQPGRRGGGLHRAWDG
jgi:hypothetical protein